LIAGRIGRDGTPRIEVPFGARGWSAVIDTGFNGDLELPEDLRSSVQPAFLCRIRSLLAAHQIIEEDAYLVQFPFDGRLIEAEATFAPGSEILIGTRLLRNYTLHLDFPEGTVLLMRTR
jgi:predicted aspartyl protease